MTITHAEILKVVTEQLIIVMELEEGELEISMQSRFQDDLELESIEMVALGDLLRMHYGDDLNFASWLTQFSLEDILELKVGDLVEWIEQCLSKS